MWSGEVGGQEEVAMRIAAFVAIRELAVQLPRPFIDVCLKAAYHTCVQSARFVSVNSISSIRFMQNGVVELFGIDFVASYVIGFV